MFVDCDDITHIKKIEIFLDYFKKGNIIGNTQFCF